MTSQKVFTDRDLRDQVTAYLQAGDSPDEFDVTGIVGFIQMTFGTVPLDDVPAEHLQRILAIHDTSVMRIRPDLEPCVRAVVGFFADRPDVPAPAYMSLQIRVDSKAALDGLAGDFGLPAPVMYTTGTGRQAQFSVELPGVTGSIVIFYFVDHG